MKLKSKYNKDFKILEVDGGGLKGTIFLVFLAELEKRLDKPCHEIFDLVIGTSTGGITAGLISAGLSTQEILDLYIKNAKKIFKKRFLWGINPMFYLTGSKYNRKFVDGLAKKHLNFPMKNSKCQLIVTSVNMRDARYTHFFKSYKTKYANVPTYMPVQATYSAPTYFGYLYDKKDLLQTDHPKGGIWADGGIGVQNCTLLEAYIEAKIQKKIPNYWILSCGCGYTTLNAGEDSNVLAQIADFIPIAREQAVAEQVLNCKELDINFSRINIKISKKHNPMDKPKYVSDYVNYGNQLIEKYMDKLLEE
jgi:patatin-like phospholipase/acyl hydrolase